MSKENAVSQENAAPATKGLAEVTPESVVEQLRALREQIPNYGQLSEPEARTLRPVSNIHPEFGQAAINAVGASQTVEATVGRSAEELQAAVEKAARWSTVRNELKATLDGVTSAILTMRHDFGQSVLLAYTVSKKLVKVPQHADLLPHVAAMRRTNRLGRTRKPPAQTPVPAPAPSTEPAPTPTRHV